MNVSHQAVPTVSIITPSYNQGEFIEETIRSVLSQQGDFVLDYIIMDGGSTDNSIEIIKKYNQLLRTNTWQIACRGISYRWTSGKDRGQADAINKGLAMVEGEIVGWLNSDDTYLPAAVSTVVSYLRDHPNVVMIYGNGYYTDENSNVTSSYPSEPFSLKRLAENCFICQPTAFVRAEALAAVGGLNESLQASMDYELWIRMGKKFEGRIVFLEDYLATSRMHQENKTRSILDRIYNENMAIMKRHFGYVEGIHVASCFYDIYENRHKTSFISKIKKISHRLFVVRYLFNIKTFFSTIRYLYLNIMKCKPHRN
jgi:glycosyltransferase involved in cell wall biosynthesis